MLYRNAAGRIWKFLNDASMHTPHTHTQPNVLQNADVEKSFEGRNWIYLHPTTTITTPFGWINYRSVAASRGRNCWFFFLNNTIRTIDEMGQWHMALNCLKCFYRRFVLLWKILNTNLQLIQIAFGFRCMQELNLVFLSLFSNARQSCDSKHLKLEFHRHFKHSLSLASTTEHLRPIKNIWIDNSMDENNHNLHHNNKNIDKIKANSFMNKGTHNSINSTRRNEIRIRTKQTWDSMALKTLSKPKKKTPLFWTEQKPRFSFIAFYWIVKLSTK